MATRGIMQLRKLKVRYCDWGGSSRGTRDFIRQEIVQFAEETPAAEIITEVNRGHHPHMVAEYVSGAQKMIGMRNMAPREILKHAFSLRNCSGRKVKKFKKPVETQYPSIQGVWDNTAPLHTIDFQLEHHDNR